MTDYPTLEGRVMADLGHQVEALRRALAERDAELSLERTMTEQWRLEVMALQSDVDRLLARLEIALAPADEQGDRDQDDGDGQ